MAKISIDVAKLKASGLPSDLMALILELVRIARQAPIKGDPGRGISTIALTADSQLRITLTDGTVVTTSSVRGLSVYDTWLALNPGGTQADFLAAMRAQATPDLLAARDAAVEAAESLEQAAETLSSLRDGSILADTGTVLIGFRNGRAAVVQRPDGLYFVPSAALRSLILGALRAAVSTSGGVPLIQYQDGRVALMQRADGLDFVPSAAFLARLPIQTPDPLSATRIQLSSVNGQSHSIGGPWDSVMTLSAAMGFANRGCLQLAGTVRTDGAAIVNSMGPGQYGYNTAIPATGLEVAVPGSQQIGLPFAAFALLNAHRADLGLPQIPVLTGAHGIGGIPLDLMDDDPATGDTTATTVWTSMTYWHAQAKLRAEAAGREIVPGWHVMNHGGAGKYMARGTYRAQWLALQRDCQDYWRSLGLPQPRYIMTQTGGEADTTNDTPGSWAVAEDQLDIVDMGSAVLGTCDYWYPIWDNQVHWDAHGTALAGETLAWGAAEVEAGRRWSITRPRVLSNTGGVLTLSFDSLREDEALEVEAAAKYNGEGIDAFLGFQLVGGVITAIDVAGRRVALSYTGTPTAVRYARQVQDVSGIAGNKYPAHRGLLRTSLRKRSKFFPSEWLVRAVPSFTLEL